MSRGKRKIQRPLSFKKSTHFILRLRQGLPAFFEPRDHKLRQHFVRTAEKHNIRVYEIIFNHSHMHSVLLLPDRAGYVRFVREVTAFITRYFQKELKVPWLRLKNIFSNRPFTRMVSWGRAYKTLIQYMRKNEKESGVAQPHIRQNESERRARRSAIGAGGAARCPNGAVKNRFVLGQMDLFISQMPSIP